MVDIEKKVLVKVGNAVLFRQNFDLYLQANLGDKKISVRGEKIADIMPVVQRVLGTKETNWRGAGLREVEKFMHEMFEV